MKLLLDEMYSVSVAEQLRARGHDVLSINDPTYRPLAGADDADVLVAAMADGRALVTENVRHFRHLEAVARADDADPRLIYTTHRQFPRRGRASIGRLVKALDELLREPPSDAMTSFFLPPPAD